MSTMLFEIDHMDSPASVKRDINKNNAPVVLLEFSVATFNGAATYIPEATASGILFGQYNDPMFCIYASHINP